MHREISLLASAVLDNPNLTLAQKSEVIMASARAERADYIAATLRGLFGKLFGGKKETPAQEAGENVVQLDAISDTISSENATSDSISSKAA